MMATATKKRKTKGEEPDFTTEGDPIAVVEAAADVDLRSDEATSEGDEATAEDPGETEKLRQRLEREVADADRDVQEAKDELKAAKDHHDALVIRLRSAIRDASNGQNKLPFPADEQFGNSEQLPAAAWRDTPSAESVGSGVRGLDRSQPKWARPDNSRLTPANSKPVRFRPTAFGGKNLCDKLKRR